MGILVGRAVVVHQDIPIARPNQLISCNIRNAQYLYAFFQKQNGLEANKEKD